MDGAGPHPERRRQQNRGEAEGPLIDTREFRQTVGQFATGVTVIAAELEGTVHAFTANSFTSLSLEPPLVLFCVGKSTKTARLLHVGARFCVNVLHEEQRDISTYF